MNISNILYWNVRGLNRRARRDCVREVVTSSRPDIVCLQETKMATISPSTILSMLGADFDQHIFLPASGDSGTRGGVLIAWRRGSCQAAATRVDTYSASVKFVLEDGNEWWFTGVYGPNLDADKLHFLQELRDIRAGCPGPWLIGGDFNLIYRSADKNNPNVDRAMMGRFRRLINELELQELELLGRRFTWSNERDSPTLVRLDRVLCSSS